MRPADPWNVARPMLRPGLVPSPYMRPYGYGGYVTPYYGGYARPFGRRY